MTFYNKGYLIVKGLISEEEAFKMHDHLNKRDDGDVNDPQALQSPSFYAE
jgi:hypothetical protein